MLVFTENMSDSRILTRDACVGFLTLLLAWSFFLAACLDLDSLVDGGRRGSPRADMAAVLECLVNVTHNPNVSSFVPDHPPYTM